MVPQPAFVLDISDYWEKKRAAIECYRSQFIEGRPHEPPTFLDRLRDQAAHGVVDRHRYGEPFASREPIGVHSISAWFNARALTARTLGFVAEDAGEAFAGSISRRGEAGP